MVNQTKKSIGIVLAGGLGNRMNDNKPKQYLYLLDKEIISYSIDAFKNSKFLDDFYIVLNPNSDEEERIRDQYNVKTIIGGNTRNDSIRNALEYIKANVSDCDKLFLNDAARPLITSEIIDFYLKKLDTHDYIYTAVKITDALGTIDNRYVDRSNHILVQAPEGYHFKDIYECFQRDAHTTYPGHTLPSSHSAYQYFDYRDNIKITYPEDIGLAEYLLSLRRVY